MDVVMSLPIASEAGAREHARRESALTGTRHVVRIAGEAAHRVADGFPRGDHEVLATYRSGEEVRP